MVNTADQKQYVKAKDAPESDFAKLSKMAKARSRMWAALAEEIADLDVSWMDGDDEKLMKKIDQMMMEDFLKHKSIIDTPKLSGKKLSDLTTSTSIDSIVRFSEAGGIITITIPRLITYREDHKNNYVRNYLYGLYQKDIHTYIKNKHDIVQTEERLAIWYCHYYVDNTRRNVPDFDNVETNTMTNIVTEALMRSDAPSQIIIGVSSEIDSYERTDILLTGESNIHNLFNRIAGMA